MDLEKEYLEIVEGILNSEEFEKRIFLREVKERQP